MAKVTKPVKEFWESDKKPDFLRITKKDNKDGIRTVSFLKKNREKKTKK